MFITATVTTREVNMDMGACTVTQRGSDDLGKGCEAISKAPFVLSTTVGKFMKKVKISL